MTNLAFKKNGIYDLPVKTVRVKDNKSYYIVETAGKEYAIRQFKYQRKEPIPEVLSCLLKDIDGDYLFFTQNIIPSLQKFYKEGETYTFWVRRDLNDTLEGYYEVADWNGLFFRLLVGKKAKLNIYQQIKCKTKWLKGSRLLLKLVKDTEKEFETSQAYALLEETLKATSASPAIARWLKMYFLKSALFLKARMALKNNEIRWPITAVYLLDSHLPEWFRQAGKRNDLLLENYREICLYLLENSDFLKRCGENARTPYAQTLSNAVQNIDELREAQLLADTGKHVSYIDDFFVKIKKSGYIYQLESRLHVLLHLFRFDPDIWKQNVQRLFDTLLEDETKRWTSEPYRSFFIPLSERYIEETHARFDRTARVEDIEEQQCLRRLINALAIRLLLYKEEDTFDYNLSHAMLYRYLTYLKGGSSTILLEKAFRILADGNRRKLEFDRKDIRELTLLTIRMSYPHSTEGTEEFAAAWSSENGKARIHITNGTIRLLPENSDRNLRPYLPEWLLPWHQLQVLLPAADRTDIPPTAKDLTAYKKMWTDLEIALLHNDNNARPRYPIRKIKPDTGDKVTIRILRQDPDNPDCLFCRIEDPGFQGSGTLNVQDIVRYNLEADIGAFYSDSGKPYLLQAVVAETNREGFYTFGMIRLLDSCIYQGVYVGETVQCLITDFLNGNYFCICYFGYCVYMAKTRDMPELAFGDYVEVEITEVRNNGYISADFLRQTTGTFSVEDAFANLIFNYADEQVYEEENDDEGNFLEEIVQEDAHICELIHIIDRVATLEEDYIKSYNYTGFARTLATLAGEEELAKYYSERMKLTEILQQFVINGQIDSERMLGWTTACGKLFADYPALRSGRIDLQVLAALDHPEQDAFLWETLQQGGNEKQKALARLVLAYNLLHGTSLREQKQAIHCELDTILNMDVERHISYSFGMEDQHSEFKTSIVYPVHNNMRPDPQKQTLEIMSVICGFLNADGGTLYLGVNDQGVASGLDADLGYFKGSLDKLDLYIRNSVVKYMGTEANARITVSYPDTGNKRVYAMNIEASPCPVMCEGIYYQRQGSSTWKLLDKSLKIFLKNRGQAARDAAEMNNSAVAKETSLQPQATETAPKPETSPTGTPATKPKEEGSIATGQIRHNATHAWMEGYGIGTIRYLHLLSGTDYLMTADECWRNDIMLSLSIHEDEADGYLVIVFESGRVVKVSINELLDKKTDKEYKRYVQEKVVFACPAHKEDALLTVMNDTQHRPTYRMDDMKNLKDGNMLAKGDYLSIVATTKVLQCEIIPEAKKMTFKKILNLPSTNIGLNLNVYWGGDELNELEKLGIKCFRE